MTTHSGILAWRIPCTKEPGGLQSMESHIHTHARTHAHTHTHTHTEMSRLPWGLSVRHYRVTHTHTHTETHTHTHTDEYASLGA